MKINLETWRNVSMGFIGIGVAASTVGITTSMMVNQWFGVALNSAVLTLNALGLYFVASRARDDTRDDQTHEARLEGMQLENQMQAEMVKLARAGQMRMTVDKSGINQAH